MSPTSTPFAAAATTPPRWRGCAPPSPALPLWIDSGVADSAALAAARRFGAPVIGSESQRDLALVAEAPDALLSLDFRGDAFLGPPELLASPRSGRSGSS